MATYFYVIVPYSVAKLLELVQIREKLPNGCFLLTQKDLISIDGKTLFERAGKIGGAIVSEGEAVLIKNGVIPVPIDNDLPEAGNEDTQIVPEHPPVEEEIYQPEQEDITEIDEKAEEDEQ